MSERLASAVRRAKKAGGAAQLRALKGALPAGYCECGTQSGVTDTRSRGLIVARRRGCPRCGAHWSTAEIRVNARTDGAIEGALIGALLIARLEQLLARMKQEG